MTNAKPYISNGVKFFNTLTRQKQEFKPIHDGEARVYTCGPTVYDYAHIGNMRAYIFADVLRRTLEHEKFQVTHIMNITDVGHLTGDRDMGEDKMAAAAKRERKTAWEIASFYTDAFLSDAHELNIITPSKLVKATDHIKDMIELIKVLEQKDFTYRTADGIYFDTSKLKNYGKLAKLDIEGLKEGARVEINNEKKNPTDFALWKFSTPLPNPPHQGEGRRQMEWESPWGVGFPGWHIECSAMSAKYLGQTFDIHTGGVDHIPVHHTNEIAQSEAAYDKPLANLWLHSEFILINKGRMSKSENNLITLEKLKNKHYSPLAYRYFVLQGHYRSKLNFTWPAMDGAQNTLNNLYEAIAEYAKAEPKVGCAEFERQFFEAMSDDLDTPKALAVMWETVNSDYPPSAKLQSLFALDKILGLSLRPAWEKLRQPIPEEIRRLAKDREDLRTKHKWKEADEVRKQIEQQGFEIRDSDKGPVLQRKIN